MIFLLNNPDIYQYFLLILSFIYEFKYPANRRLCSSVREQRRLKFFNTFFCSILLFYVDVVDEVHRAETKWHELPLPLLQSNKKLW